jgi:hypothetical protein
MMIEKLQKVCVSCGDPSELPKRVAAIDQLIGSAIEAALWSLTLKRPAQVRNFVPVFMLQYR